MQQSNLSSTRGVRTLLVAGVLLAAGAAQADMGRPDMGKFLATGGVSQLEGAAGGGLTPWALIGGYGTRDSWGANLHYTGVRTQDYALDSSGVAVGLADRLELSLAGQTFTGSLALLDEKAYYDAFVAWFPNKHVSLTAAYAVLGDITVFNPVRQRGPYLSLQAGF
jgi:hypothetical protein